MLVLGFTAGLHKIIKLVPGGLIWGFLLEGLFVASVWLFIALRMPDRRRSWTDLIPGSLLVGYGMSLLSVVGRLYLPPRFAHSSAIYGSLGIASVMLLWFLLIGQLIVSSSLANSVWSDYRAGGAEDAAPLADTDLLSYSRPLTVVATG